MKWSNPLGWIYADVTGEDGTKTNWALETGAANNLIRRGCATRICLPARC